eukprot:scaffold907_cov247-Pinguiococcus_pyrenoidosus.AAC.12
MLRALHDVAGMVAEGFGLEPGVFQRLMENGPHLLAPTGSDFSKHAELNKALAGFHYDLNFLTIHGKSRFPGLFIWLRDGTRARAVVPEGDLFLPFVRMDRTDQLHVARSVAKAHPFSNWSACDS